jgi:hypothetical protein
VISRITSNVDEQAPRRQRTDCAATPGLLRARAEGTATRKQLSALDAVVARCQSCAALHNRFEAAEREILAALADRPPADTRPEFDMPLLDTDPSFGLMAPAVPPAVEMGSPVPAATTISASHRRRTPPERDRPSLRIVAATALVMAAAGAAGTAAMLGGGDHGKADARGGPVADIRDNTAALAASTVRERAAALTRRLSRDRRLARARARAEAQRRRAAAAAAAVAQIASSATVTPAEQPPPARTLAPTSAAAPQRQSQAAPRSAAAATPHTSPQPETKAKPLPSPPAPQADPPGRLPQ